MIRSGRWCQDAFSKLRIVMAGKTSCAWRASKRTRLGFSNWISDASSMRRIRSSSVINLPSAFNKVVLPHPVPLLLRMF